MTHQVSLGLVFTALSVLASTSAFAGSIPVRNGDNLQAAINAAQPGDVLELEAGATFTGNFVLPVKSGSTFITITTAPAAGLPAAGVRVGPADAPKLARIRSGNTMAALRTAPGAHHWRIQLLEFDANRDGYGEILQIGDGSSAQNQLSLVPHAIELDRLYIHGDPDMGQKRGIALNARDVTIRNCYISGIRGVGLDSQAIGGWNGPGPFWIENNYLEAAGENIMLGGADPSIPGLVSDGVTIRRNHFTRPLSWQNPVLDAPGGIAAEVLAGGSLASGRHYYHIVARRPVANGTIARSALSAEASVPTYGGAAIRLTWAHVPGATEYVVYGRSPLGVTQYWSTTTTSFTDTGAPGKPGAAPTSAGSVWTVKNLLELKNARNVVVEENLFENNWAGAQGGYAIVLTPRNQNGACTWCVVEHVAIQRNIVRNVAGGINILGRDDLAPSQQTNRILISRNLFTVSTRMGGSGWFLLMGNQPSYVVIDHNTIDADGTTLLYVYGGGSSAILPVQGFQFTNNAARHSLYGINGAQVSFGNQILTAFFPDSVVAGNWLQGGDPNRYPAGNYFDGQFTEAFTNLAAGDYSAVAGGPLANRATDGTNIGADAPGLATTISSIATGTTVTPAPTMAQPRNLRIISR